MSHSTDKLVIYFFSGTGNSRHVSSWIAEKAEKENLEVDIVDLGKLKKRTIEKPEKEIMLGFISPTHGFNFPPIMFHFLLRLPRASGNQAFIINTRAGMKIGKFFLPGLSGLAQLLSALILKLKGYRIIGMHPIDLPSNWISLHPGLKTKVIESIFEKRKKETEKFIQRILEGKKDLKALYDMIQDLIISPIALLYYLFGRFFLAKTFIASSNCSQCNLCIKQCPVNAIKKIDNRMFWTYRCESCMQCMNKCPERAIETAHGFVAGLLILMNSVIMVWLYGLSNVDEFLNESLPHWLNETAHLIFYTVILFIVALPVYRLIHYLMRFKIFERAIVLTSLTKYKFWRRYKPPKDAA